MPAMWYGGTLTSAASSSSAPMNSTVRSTYDARCRWRRTAALGSPVVPLVNSRIATSSGSATARRRRARRRRPRVELGARHHGDAVDAGDAADLGVVADDQRRRDAGQHGPEPIVGQPVVDRRERHAGDRAAEQQRGSVAELTSTRPTRSTPDADQHRDPSGPGRAARRR